MKYEGYCADRYPCWKHEMCPVRCKLQYQVASQGISCLDSDHVVTPKFCYNCTDCPSIMHNHFAPVDDCQDVDCMEVLVGSVIERGCLNETKCKNSEICRTCKDNFCNHQQYGIECIVCSFDNPKCTYDPLDTWTMRHPYPYEANMSVSCYSILR